MGFNSICRPAPQTQGPLEHFTLPSLKTFVIGCRPASASAHCDPARPEEVKLDGRTHSSCSLLNPNWPVPHFPYATSTTACVCAVCDNFIICKCRLSASVVKSAPAVLSMWPDTFQNVPCNRLQYHFIPT